MTFSDTVTTIENVNVNVMGRKTERERESLVLQKSNYKPDEKVPKTVVVREME